MAEIGRAELVVIPSFKGGQRALEKQLGVGSGGPMGGAGKKAGGMFAGGFKSMVGPAIAAVSAGAAINFGKDLVGAASDLGESLNALDVVYGDLSSTVDELGQDAARDLGLSNVDFNSLAVQFSNFVKTVAGEGGDVAGTLDDLTTRASDFASVMNLEVAESATLFQSGLAGETEPLRRFGIDLSAAAVESYAYANGIADVGEKLTEAEKVQARYGSLMEQTEQTAGDFANTSGELANQQRILAAEWDNMRAELGSALLPVMQDVTGWLLNDGLPALQTFITDLGDPTTLIGGLASTLETAFTEAFNFAQNIDAEGWDVAAPEFGAELSAWAEAGDSVAQQFVGAIDATMESFVNGTVGDDWISGTALIGEKLSGWGDAGGDAGQQFVSTLDQTLQTFADEGWGGIFDSWRDGVGDLLNSSSPFSGENPAFGTTGRQENRIPRPGTGADVPAITAPSQLDLNTSKDIVSAITASGGAPTNIYVDTINASDTDDIVRKATQSKRTNSWAGSRGGLTPTAPWRR